MSNCPSLVQNGVPILGEIKENWKVPLYRTVSFSLNIRLFRTKMYW
jgi:hypothetical protein